jgi:hypothetical protein
MIDIASAHLATSPTNKVPEDHSLSEIRNFMPDYVFKNVRKLDCAGEGVAFPFTAAAPTADTQPVNAALPQKVDICYLDTVKAASMRPTANGLRRCGIDITEHHVPFAGARRNSVALIVDQLCSPTRLLRNRMLCMCLCGSAAKSCRRQPARSQRSALLGSCTTASPCCAPKTQRCA